MDKYRKTLENFCTVSLVYLVAFAVGFAPALSAEARPKTAPGVAAAEKEKGQKLVKFVLEGIHSKDDVIGLLSHAGVSIEGLKVIDADLTKRMSSKVMLPKMSLAKDEVVVDGQATGLHVVSYEPMKLKYQDRTWSLNEKVSTDENYASMMKFLETRKSAALLSLALPQANAFFEDGMTGLLSGSLMGAMGGALFGMAFGFNPLTSMLVGGAGGAIFGYLYGKSNEPVVVPAYVPGQAYPAAR
jgi:hypothetical protein